MSIFTSKHREDDYRDEWEKLLDEAATPEKRIGIPALLFTAAVCTAVIIGPIVIFGGK